MFLANIYRVILALTFIVFGFQNCSKKVDFAQLDERLVPVDSPRSDSDQNGAMDDDDTDDNDNAMNDDDGVDNDDRDDNQNQDDETGEESHHHRHHGHHGRNYCSRDEQGNEYGSSDSEDEVQTSNADEYFCILNASGNSRHIGYVNQQMVEERSTPQGVCMSENACENLVSQVFDVKYAKHKGACHGNPHVIHMSDSQISDLIASMRQ